MLHLTGAALLQPVQNTGGATQYQQHFTLSGKLSKSANTVQCDATSYQVAAYVTGNINGHKNRGVARIQDCFCMAHVAVGAHQCLLHSAWGLNNYLSTTARQRLSQAGIDPTAAQLPQQGGLWV